MLDINGDNKTENTRDSSLSTNEVAFIFGVDPATIRRWYHQGKIGAERENMKGILRFSRTQIAILFITREIESFIKGNHTNMYRARYE